MNKEQRIKEKETLIKEILNRVPKKYTKEIFNSIDFASYIHTDQFRISGESYLVHSLNVALNCARLKLDSTSIIVAILHQTISPRLFNITQINKIKEEINAEFGKEILELVEEVENINQATKVNKEVNTLTLKRYLLNTTKDIRPLIIKTADVLDDLRTIEYLPIDKLKPFCKKVLDIYGPISEYLNLSELKKEIEEEAFKNLDNEIYNTITTSLEEENINIRLKNKYIQYLKVITDILGYEPKIIGRVKGKYSIYQKLKKYFKEGKGYKLETIKDIMAFSIITQEKEDCLTITQAIKSLTKEDLNLFDDYITHPKPNGYSAIQMTTQIPEISKLFVEIQVLTYEMYQYNTYGPASHIAYKASKTRFAKNSESMDWVENIHLQIKNNIHQREDRFSIPINGSIFNQRVFAFTPKGLIIELPENATVLDFAYQVHSKIGDRAVSAIVNNKPAKTSTTLNTGDVVEIVVDKSKKTHNPEALGYAVTDFAKKHIRKGLKQYR